MKIFWRFRLDPQDDSKEISGDLSFDGCCKLDSYEKMVDEIVCGQKRKIKRVEMKPSY